MKHVKHEDARFSSNLQSSKCVNETCEEVACPLPVQKVLQSVQLVEHDM